MGQQILDQYEDVAYVYSGKPVNFPAVVGPVLRATGWGAGTFVMYSPPTGVDEFEVERSDGSHLCGMLLRPSENYSSPQGGTQNYTSAQWRLPAGGAASTVTVMRGNVKALFRYFETVSLDGGGVRVGPPITYSLNEWLRISENGLLCNDPAANLILAGVAAPIQMGLCCAVPAPRNGNRLGMDFRW